MDGHERIYMSTTTIYCLAPTAEDQEFVRELARITSHELKFLSEPQEFATKIAEHSALLFLSDKSNKFQELFEAVKQCCFVTSDFNRIYHIVDPERLNLVPSNAKQYIPEKGNFIVRKYDGNPSEAAAAYARVILASARESVFGLHNFFETGTPIKKFVPKFSTERTAFVEIAEKFFSDTGVDPRIVAQATNALDELLMNAIFDAPVEGGLRTFHVSALRTARIALEEKHSVEFYIGADEHYLALSVVDFYGSVNWATILSHLTRNLSQEPYQADALKQNNGLGLAMILKSGASIVVACKENSKTEISVFFNKTTSQRKAQNQMQFIATKLYQEKELS